MLSLFFMFSFSAFCYPSQSQRLRGTRCDSSPPSGASQGRAKPVAALPLLLYFHPAFSQIRAQRSGSDLERKKETADVQFSGQALNVARFSRIAMLLRKPRKQNGAGFF